MDLVIFMIHLCTIATLMFVQNNTSQKILFIAARTIQFPGVVFKVCIYIICLPSSPQTIYFDVQKYPYLSKIYISAIISVCLQHSSVRRETTKMPAGKNLVGCSCKMPTKIKRASQVMPTKRKISSIQPK